MNIQNKNIKELQELAHNIREQIILAVDQYGGHLASNLGMVELSLAMHFIFEVPKDKFLFDVGHQAYAHKILTDRTLDGLRQPNGTSGFPSPLESDCDQFTVGHASTAISSAVGLARARDLQNQSYEIVAIIGDGALGGGMAYEALNDLGASGKKVIVILNDNKMSISKNVGAMSRHLAKLRLKKGYVVFKNNIKRGFSALPIIGRPIVRLIDHIKDSVRLALFKGSVIESLGIKYYGPFDGHDLPSMIKILGDIKNDTRNQNKPIFLHFVTEKGKGVEIAEQDPSKYHGLPANQFAKDIYKYTIGKDFVPNPNTTPTDTTSKDTTQKEDNTTSPTTNTSKAQPISNSKTMTDCLIQQAQKDDKIVCITAAMGSGTGLEAFADIYPDRYFDVGIAEQHAVTMAAGLAKGGFKPYFAVYSTFLQRAYDQLIHDISVDNLPVRFCIDRAGVVSGDGVTHQGIYDIAYLNTVPNMMIMQPKDSTELQQMLEASFTLDQPLSIRYPKDSTIQFDNHNNFALGKWEWMTQNPKPKTQNPKPSSNSIATQTPSTTSNDNLVNTYPKTASNVVILAVGERCIHMAMPYADTVNCRFIKPLDKDFLDTVQSQYDAIITLEDGIIIGGFGQQVRQYCVDTQSNIPVYTVGYTPPIRELDANTSLQMLETQLQNILQNLNPSTNQ